MRASDTLNMYVSISCLSAEEMGETMRIIHNVPELESLSGGNVLSDIDGQLRTVEDILSDIGTVLEHRINFPYILILNEINADHMYDKVENTEPGSGELIESIADIEALDPDTVLVDSDYRTTRADEWRDANGTLFKDEDKNLPAAVAGSGDAFRKAFDLLKSWTSFKK